MNTFYDQETDALYVRFGAAAVVESEEVRPNLVIDFDETGRIVAIEMLKASQQVSGDVSGLVPAA